MTQEKTTLTVRDLYGGLRLKRTIRAQEAALAAERTTSQQPAPEPSFSERQQVSQKRILESSEPEFD